ncbi:MAG: bifunctional adenosylcobinamide kinase/adenosylcobinamide-phosphate guanylyltransferase [Synergistaceae bacterium]|nr:bifunctional adenosylcobinamide kinase/adenosylcobinamide-phosphate guanylyltransferase [Synergistaceae bacterium]
MGKKNYALKLYGSFDSIMSLETFEPEEIREGLITDLHIGARKLLIRNINPLEFFAERLDILRHSVITGDEIGGGVIPVDTFGRKWRDETGKLYQFLADKAEIVDRVTAGLPMRLKGFR